MPRGDDPPVLRPAILLRSPQSTPCVPLLLCAIDFSVPLGLSFLGPFRRPVRGSPRDFRFAPPPSPFDVSVRISSVSLTPAFEGGGERARTVSCPEGFGPDLGGRGCEPMRLRRNQWTSS